MIESIIVVKVIMTVGFLLLGQTLSNMIREYHQADSNLENPF